MISIASMVGYLARAIAAAFYSLIYPFWSYGSQYGLGPNYAFLGFAINNPFYQALLRGTTEFGVIPLIPILTLAFSLWFIILSATSDGIRPLHFMYRMALSVMIALTVSYAVQVAYESLGSIYVSLYYSSGIQWDNVFSVTGNPIFSNYVQPTFNMLNLLTVTGFFVGTGVFFGSLIARVAVLLVIMVILPFSAVLTMIPKVEIFFYRLISVCIGLMFEPFLGLLILYLCWIFRIQAIQISLLISLPIIVSFFIFGSPGLNLSGVEMMGDLTLPSIQDRAFGMFRGVNDVMSGNSALGYARIFSSLNSDHPSRWAFQKPPSDPDIWQSLINEELKFRRDY
ncbi:MAG: hypothetical protein QW812_04095 [Thermoplasmataceae archaeon]